MSTIPCHWISSPALSQGENESSDKPSSICKAHRQQLPCGFQKHPFDCTIREKVYRMLKKRHVKSKEKERGRWINTKHTWLD